jgi:hypothetical protein
LAAHPDAQIARAAERLAKLTEAPKAMEAGS